ncbi:MAG: NADPH2:quinone reductase [Gammaproteobacteria bacterium]|jgi:NADPH2:quinone reductase
MKAAVYYKNGGPDVLKYEDVADPIIKPKDILIQVKCVSIEGGDTLNRLGGPLRTHPHVVGYQAAGEIIQLGSEVTGHSLGDRVTTVMGDGSHAELRAVHMASAWKIPDEMSYQIGSAIPVPFGTAHDCLFEYGRLQAGETVLVQAGASAVGLASIQLAKRAGAMVIATASSAEKLAKLKELGMDYGINYVDDDLVKEVMRLTDGKGANVIVDPVGGSTMQKSINSLAYRGRLSTVGGAGREKTNYDLSNLMGGNRSINGVFLGAEIRTERAQKMIKQLILDIAAGDLTVVLDKQFPLSEAAAAHEFIESRKAVGRVTLVP